MPHEILHHRTGVGMNELVAIEATDEADASGACHRYQVSLKLHGVWGKATDGSVKFQKGPVEEHGPNGSTNETLIAILVDRLAGFQQGPHPCRENNEALKHLEEALHWLHARTRRVEGGKP